MTDDTNLVSEDALGDETASDVSDQRGVQEQEVGDWKETN
ncbi:hypothetical protein Natoc_1966 [Natronococcus occultus SP4]|uniref:Uncharacterized protein n=1 Tax=Natronococcus occultus SP4 TaxID=694430 RepID=L0JYB8_9EURY|nr:hypothetical protein Natoc_1966 [Natronococcus occultus SP4]